MSELPRSNQRLWIAALAASLAFLAVDSAARMRAIGELTERAGGGPRSVVIDEGSPSGFEGNQHRTIVPIIGTDGYHWVMQTQQMLAEGNPRVRHVTYDGPPDGRSVHWSASLHWIAALSARAASWVTGQPTLLSVERVFPWANSVLFAVLLTVFVMVSARRFGNVAAALLAIAAVATYPTYEFFAAGNFDHHGLAAFAAVGSVLLILGGGGGWIASTDQTRVTRADRLISEWLTDGRIARRWFIASGIAGGIGLWVSAATAVPTLIGTGLGASLSALLVKSDTGAPWRTDPRLWRMWGIAGAITSVAFYALEYLPSHMGLHLEVNHPLHAVAWLGAGDLLFRVHRVRASAGRLRNDLAGIAFDVLMIAAAPATALLVPGSFVLRPDSFLVGLHEDYITEFRPLLTQIEGWSVTQFMAGIGLLLPLVLVPACIAASSKRLPAPVRSMVTVALLPVFVFVVLTLRQGRWLGVATSLSLCVLVALAFAASTVPALGLSQGGSSRRRVIAAALVALALVPFPALTIQRMTSREGAYAPTGSDLAQVVTRDVAQKLRSRLGTERGVVASGPTTTTWMSYFGGLKGIGSLYWENEAGLFQAAGLFGAPMTELTATAQDSAFMHIQRLGVTHVVLFSWNAFAKEYAHLALGVRAETNASPSIQKRIDESFGLRLVQGAIPVWLRPLPYRVPAIAGFSEPWALILEVAPNQSAEEAATRSAQYCLAMNDEATALSQLQIALEANPAYVPALLTLARIEAARPNRPNTGGALQRLLSALRTNDAMALEDRIGLASLFTTLGDTAAARAAIRRAIELATEADVRRLPWDYTAANFFILARQFGLAEMRPNIMELVFRTLDPSVQAQIGSPGAR